MGTYAEELKGRITPEFLAEYFCPAEFFNDVAMFECPEIPCIDCWKQECKGEE